MTVVVAATAVAHGIAALMLWRRRPVRPFRPAPSLLAVVPVRRRWPAVVALAAAGAAFSFPWGAVCGAVVPLLRRAVEGRARRRRAVALAEDVEVLVVLCELALLGGVSLQRALADAAPWCAAEIAGVVDELLGRVAHGGVLADELDALAAGPYPALGGLARVVGATERYGTPASAGLAVLVAEHRLDRARRLEAEARRVPVQLLVPLVGGVLPAFVLLSVAPMLAGALGHLRGGWG